MRKLRQLSPAEWRGLSAAYLYLFGAGCWLFIRRKKLDLWLNNGSTIAAGKPLTPEEFSILYQRARWVNAAARYPWPWVRCLQRSLALCLWLEKLGFQPLLRIGVRKDGAALAAHAWVEYEGRIINDRPGVSGEFVVLKGADPEKIGAGLSRERRWI